MMEEDGATDIEIPEYWRTHSLVLMDRRETRMPYVDHPHKWTGIRYMWGYLYLTHLGLNTHSSTGLAELF
ncbi:hypothetical protein PSCICN_40650 [Pseudomonas cichorii]|nr:hypothetical protein PSCICN_40650 [Pseudomonas cichorii]